MAPVQTWECGTGTCLGLEDGHCGRTGAVAHTCTLTHVRCPPTLHKHFACEALTPGLQNVTLLGDRVTEEVTS